MKLSGHEFYLVVVVVAGTMLKFTGLTLHTACALVVAVHAPVALGLQKNVAGHVPMLVKSKVVAVPTIAHGTN